MKKTVLAVVLLSLLSLVFALSATAGPAMDRILGNGELVVGTSGAQPPMTAITQKGEIIGLDADVAKAMAAALGVKLKFKILPFAKLLPALQAGKVDMVISGLTMTPQRNMTVGFVGPYHISGKALLTKFKSMVTSEDTAKLNSEAFAYVALESSTSASLVETLMPKSRLVTAKNYEEAVEMVLSNKVDALVADYHVCVLSLLRHPNEGLVSLITPFTYEPLGIAMPAGDAQMMNWTTNFLNTMRQSDELIKLKVKWIEDPSWLMDLK